MSGYLDGKKAEKCKKDEFNLVYFVNHSHMDNSWGGTPQECLDRNLEILDQAIKACEENPEFHFSQENVHPLYEFAERYPDRIPSIGRLLNSGSLEVGGGYIHPTIDYCFDECIVRNLQLGKKWLKNTFEYDAKLVYEEDVPGHTLQTPQVLRRAGVRYLKISRGPPSIFHWTGPDGSSVLTYSAEYSWSHHSLLGDSPEETMRRLPDELKKAKNNYKTSNLMIPDGDDWTPPNLKLLEIVKAWNERAERPRLRLATAQEFFASVQGEESIPVLSGDMPNVWVGVAAVEAEIIRRLRRIQNIIFSAEEFTALSSLLGGEQRFKDLEDAWRLILLTADHNWGGKDPSKHGEYCDEEKLRYIKEAETLCLKQLEKALENMVSRIDTTSSSGPDNVPLIVFNQLPWERTDLIEFEVNHEADPSKIQVSLPDGTYVPSQTRVVFVDDSKRMVRTSFIAEDIPPTGYRTYFINFNKPSERVETILNVDQNVVENRFFRVEIDPKGRGISRFVDKDRGVEIGGEKECFLGPLRFKFMLNEVFGLGLKLDVKRVPTVVGRSTDLITANATGDIFRADDDACKITTVEDGPVKATVLVESTFIDSIRKQEITAYEKLNRIDLKTSIEWKGRNFIAVMLMFPMNLERASDIVVNVPFGSVNLTDVAPGFWVKRTDPLQFKVRGVQHWIDLSDSGGGATLCTNWPCFDFTMTPAAVILWSMDSENSFFFGKRYRQIGTHTLAFSLVPHRGGWRMSEAYRNGLSIAFPLIPIITSQHSGFLPKEMSLIKVDGKNIIVTAVKKADDERGFIIRAYEAEGKQSNFAVEFYREIKECWETNPLEEDIRTVSFYEGRLELPISPYEIRTIRVVFQEN